MKRFLSLLLGLAIVIGVQAQDSDVGYPESVWLDNPDIMIRSSGWHDLGVQFSPDSDEINKEMTWTFSKEGIVEIENWGNGNYVIQGLEFGTTTFTGTTVNGLEITGTATVSGIKFENYECDMTVGQSMSLGMSISSDEILNALNWSINDTNIVSVSQDGIVTALSPGQTWIYARAYVNNQWYETSAYITVRPEAGSVALDSSNISIQPGNWASLYVLLPEGEDNYDGTWSNSNESVVRIEGYSANWCDISGLSNGTAVITYTAPNGASASCTVTVYTGINDFTLNAEEKDLIPGETFQIEIVSTDPENAGQTFSYSSDNEEVATVDANGLVTAVGYGETWIYVNPEQQGWPDRSIRVTVAKMPESVWLENTDIQITRLNSSTYYLDVQFSPDNDEVNKNIEWSVSEDGIIDIYNWGNGNYVACGRNFGTVTITGTTPNGLTVEGNVTVSGIKFENYECDMTVGQSMSLGMSISSDEILNALNWSIDDTNIVSVSQDGIVTALSPGQTWIYASAYVNNQWYETSAYITVRPEAGSVALNYSNISIRPGNWAYLYVLLPEGEDNYDGTWSNSNESVVRIEGYSANWCDISGLSNGTAVITYTAPNGASASCTVTVYTGINDFTLNAEEVNLIPEETFQIEIVSTDPENAGQTFSYSSDNEEVATVDANGLVTAVGYGETWIDVNPEQQGWPYRSIRVTVAKMPESVWLENTDIQITRLNSSSYYLDVQFSPDNDEVNKNIEWSVSEDGIIDIYNWGNGNYVACGRNFGTVTITGTTPNGLTVEGNVTVSGIKFENYECDMTVGQSMSLGMSISSDEILNALNWIINDTNIVSVSQDGIVTALSPGQTWIYASAYVNNQWYETSAYITVRPEAGSVALNSSNISIPSGDWADLYVLLPEGEDNYDGTWSNSNESVVRIEGYSANWCGISGLSNGTAVITYTAPNGASASCTVTVYTWIDDLSLNASEVSLGTGETFQIAVTTDPADAGQTLTYRSEDENVATVDENGLVKAVGIGNTYIQVYPEQQGWPIGWLYVQVRQMPESFEILNPEITFNGVDLTTLVEISFTPDGDDVCKDITWVSSDPNIGDIVKMGNNYWYVSGSNFGTANITLTTVNGLTQDAVINVTGIKIVDKPDSYINMLPGETIQFTAEASSPEILDGCTWETSNRDVVSIDENGLATALKYGEAQINVSKYLDGIFYNDWVNINVLPEVGSVAISQETMSMRVGEWNTLYAYNAAFEDDYSGSWSSSNEDVIKINGWWWSNPWICGIDFMAEGIGETVITYTSGTGATASCVVTVSSDIEGIVLNVNELNDLQPRDTFQIEAFTLPENIDAQYIYQSQNSEIASVDDAGLITINGYGETVIHVYLAQNTSIEATITVKVTAYPESISVTFDGGESEITVTNTSSLSTIPLDVVLNFPEDVTTEDEDYVNNDIIWTCEPEGIVEVVTEIYEEYDPVGNPMRKLSPRVLKSHYVIRPTGRELGNVTITGTTANGLTATVNINVTGIAFPYGDMELEVSESRHIDVTTIPEELANMLTWSVADTNIAEVANQTVIAKSAGHTTVYATATNDGVYYSASFDVQVNLKQPTSITALKDYINLSVGETATYAVKNLFQVEPTEDVDDNLYLVNGNYNVISFATEKRDDGQYVTIGALNEGESEIGAYTSNWLYSRIPVYVSNEPLAITLSETEVYLRFLNTKQLSAIVTPSDREVEITWSSSDPEVVSVTGSGLITAEGVGKATVTATATDKNGVTASASCTVHVLKISGVEEILEDGETCDVYTVDGIFLKKNATADDFKTFTNGVYVIQKGNETFKIKI